MLSFDFEMNPIVCSSQQFGYQDIHVFILSKSIRLKYQWKQTNRAMQEDGYTRNLDLL